VKFRRSGSSWKIGVALVIFGLSGILAIAAQSPRYGRTVASITVGQDNLDRVRSLYGSGAETTVDGVRSLCYHFAQNQAYLSVSTFERQVRVRSITLTTIADVTPGCRDANVSGKHLTGPGGIQLGDTMQTVTAAIGRPSKTGKLHMGSHELQYADYAIVGGHATCQFESDKLILIGVALD
jgi:hypothetical protein